MKEKIVISQKVWRHVLHIYFLLQFLLQMFPCSLPASFQSTQHRLEWGSLEWRLLGSWRHRIGPRKVGPAKASRAGKTPTFWFHFCRIVHRTALLSQEADIEQTFRSALTCLGKGEEERAASLLQEILARPSLKSKVRCCVLLISGRLVGNLRHGSSVGILHDITIISEILNDSSVTFYSKK